MAIQRSVDPSVRHFLAYSSCDVVCHFLNTSAVCCTFPFDGIVFICPIPLMVPLDYFALEKASITGKFNGMQFVCF